MKSKLIQQGAEAKILKQGSKIIKDRIPKSYRLPDLDEKIRKQRTKRESKILEKASKLIPVPKIFDSSEKDKTITLEYISGFKLSDYLNELKNSLPICKTLGAQLAILHDNNIIHGDLTTSNLILSKKDKKLYFIDFGLSYISTRAEDKATDLHLIKEALEAKHFPKHSKFFNKILEGYSKSKNAKETLKRLEKVELRGRYKQQY